MKLDVGEVERTLGIKADILIPSDVVVPQSVNKGAPVVLDAPKSGVAKSLESSPTCSSRRTRSAGVSRFSPGPPGR